MRIADGIPLKEVMQQMRHSSPHKHKLEEAAWACAWKAVMPVSVTKRTEATFHKQRRLFIRLNSAPLRHEFQLNKDKVIALLQNYVQSYSLADVVFV